MRSHTHITNTIHDFMNVMQDELMDLEYKTPEIINHYKDKTETHSQEFHDGERPEYTH